MKKTAYYYLSLAAIVAGGLVSCQDENQGFTQDEISYAATQRDYTKNFIAKYGEIDPNHTWGFGSSATRALEGDVHAYYKVNRGEIMRGVKTGFQTGTEMTSTEFNFFKSSLPPEVTVDEAKYVCQYIYNHPEEGYEQELFTTYFVQSVAKVKHTYSYYDNNHSLHSDVGCSKMDYLHIDQEHNNDFNSSNCGWIFDPTIVDEKCTAMTPTGSYQPLEALVVRSKTTNPTYKDSWSGGTCDYSPDGDHVIYGHALYYRVEWPVNSGKYGTYLAFDYASAGGEETGDGHYDDWVVKITDAHRATNRVFCEDLGSIHDWDFNDLVFDYTIESGWVYIDVLAFSGTLPLGSNFADGDKKLLIESHEPEGAEPGHAFLPKEAPILKSYKFESAYTDIQQFTFWAVHNSTSQWETSKDNHDIPVNARWAIRNQSGCAPYMIQVPTTVNWPDEEQEIGVKYPNFKKWVGNNGDGHTDWWK